MSASIAFRRCAPAGAPVASSRTVDRSSSWTARHYSAASAGIRDPRRAYGEGVVFSRERVRVSSAIQLRCGSSAARNRSRTRSSRDALVCGRRSYRPRRASPLQKPVSISAATRLAPAVRKSGSVADNPPLRRSAAWPGSYARQGSKAQPTRRTRPASSSTKSSAPGRVCGWCRIMLRVMPSTRGREWRVERATRSTSLRRRRSGASDRRRGNGVGRGRVQHGQPLRRRLASTGGPPSRGDGHDRGPVVGRARRFGLWSMPMPISAGMNHR